MSLSCPANPGERDTSLPPVYNETDTKRSGPPLDPVSSSYRVRPFIRGNKSRERRQLRRRIYLFISFFFSRRRRRRPGKLRHLRRITLGTHKRHRIQFKRTGVSNLEKFGLLVFRDTYIHFLRAERRIINRSKGKILLLELLY